VEPVAVEFVDGRDVKDADPVVLTNKDDRTSRDAFGDLETLIRRVTLLKCRSMELSIGKRKHGDKNYEQDFSVTQHGVEVVFELLQGDELFAPSLHGLVVPLQSIIRACEDVHDSRNFLSRRRGGGRARSTKRIRWMRRVRRRRGSSISGKRSESGV
jgi:hypothetical protein